jgi:hypothetical protein
MGLCSGRGWGDRRKGKAGKYDEYAVMGTAHMHDEAHLTRLLVDLPACP